MTLFEKRFAAGVLAFGAIMAVIGYFAETPFGIIILLACLLHTVYVYFSSNGDDDGNS
jgi:hypothetical protein